MDDGKTQTPEERTLEKRLQSALTDIEEHRNRNSEMERAMRDGDALQQAYAADLESAGELLDDTINELDRNVRILESFGNRMAESDRQVRRVRSELAEAREKFGTHDEVLRQRDSELANARKALESTKAELITRSAELKNAHHGLEERDGVLESQRAELRSKRSELLEADTLLRDAREGVERVSREMLAKEQELGRALTQLRLFEELSLNLGRQADRDIEALEIADQLAKAVSALQGSTAWKLVKPVLTALLSAGLIAGRRSSTLVDIRARVEAHERLKRLHGRSRVPTP